MNSNVSFSMDHLVEFCRVNGIARLAIFGSALRADFGPESDIDLLVDFEPGRTLGFFDFARMEQAFADLFGRKVGLVERLAIEQNRNYIRRAEILGTAETIYAA